MLPKNHTIAAGLLATCMIVGAATACAADASANADVDLFRAKLHKGGETPAAVAIWQRWARQGNADAAYNLAVIHQHADGVERDLAKAMRWYRTAAERGDKVSQFQIGLMYLNGDGVPADPKIAHEWFTKHRQEHVHHHHTAQYLQWQQQALALIEERDRREARAAARRDGEAIMAELKRRAATVPTTTSLGVAATY
jgi:hypothetical protein